MIRPVGVSPASAIENTAAVQFPFFRDPEPWRNRITAAATHGRQPYPSSRLQ